MQDVVVCSGRRSKNLSRDEQWQAQIRLVFGRLAETERRWVSALISGAVGWGGETFAAMVTGLDPKTVHSGRIELENDLNDCPADRIRRSGAGRVPVEKKTRQSKAI